MDDRLDQASVHDMLRRQAERLSLRREPGAPPASRNAYPTIINTYAPGETIVPARARADCMGLVVRGRVAVHPHPRRDSWPSTVLSPGQTFGQAMLAQRRPSAATLKALTHSEIWFLHRLEPEVLSREHPVHRPATPVWRQLLGALLLAAVLLAILKLAWAPTQEASSLAFMGLGQWCSELGHDPCAERAWKVAAALLPSDANPPLALGTLYAMRGEFAAAESSFEQVEALLPGSPEVLNNLGFLYAGRGDHERALGVLRQALVLEPGNAVIEHNLGRSLQALGAHDEALLHYTSSLALDGPRAGTLANMAIAYYETGQPAQAVEAASLAVRYDDSLAPAHAVLGVVALDSDHPEKAVLHLHRALSLDSGYGPAYLSLGLAYGALGQGDEAVAALRQALRYADDGGVRARIQHLLDGLYDQQGTGANASSQ